jgi:hypothetical protein
LILLIVVKKSLRLGLVAQPVIPPYGKLGQKDHEFEGNWAT